MTGSTDEMRPEGQEAGESAAASESSNRKPVLRFWISSAEETRGLTVLSVTGLMAGIALVVLGGTPWDTPMLTHSFGWVEPTCGLTRGSTALMRGDLALAWRYNPTSFLVVGGAVAWLGRTILARITGRWLNLRIHPSTTIWIGLAVSVALLWAFQQSNAEFIMNSRL